MSQEKDNKDAQQKPMDISETQFSDSESPFVSHVDLPGPDSDEMNFRPGMDMGGDISEQDLFVGDFSFLKELTAKKPSYSAKQSIATLLAHPVYLVVGANVLITLFLFGLMWFRPEVETEPRIVVLRPQTTPSPSQAQSLPKATTTTEQKPAEEKPAAAQESGEFALNQDEQQQLNVGVSLKTADDLFAAKEYLKACYMYQQIGSDWVMAGHSSEYVKDYLKLRMAVCLQRAGEEHAQEQYFAQSLQSRSAYVRGMTCYYLARIHYQNREYLEARRRAYQSLALWRAFNDMVTVNLEKDLYFLVAESLSREVLSFYNVPQELPGRGWSDNLIDVWPAEQNLWSLEQALSATAEKLAQGVGAPRVTVDTNQPIGSQWSLYCLNSPLEETLWKAITQAGMKANWKANLEVVRTRPISAYLTYMPQQYVTEVVCGSAGLLWQFDGQDVTIVDPATYTDFENHRQSLIQEAVSVWQRFMLRYRDDSRIANVHYSLGRMYTFGDQTAAAMGEYKLLQGPFAQDPLAPYAFLEASKIKVEIKDYEGARMDLNEMLLIYPDCPIADEATLYLARATLESGKPDAARGLFNKAFQMSLSRSGRCSAALGMGQCAFIQKDWTAVVTWLNRAMEFFDDKRDARISSVCFMLGRAYLAQGKCVDASKVLRTAMRNKLSDKEYVQIIIELVNAEMRQGNFLEAMNIIESVPQPHLGQEELCDLLITKARIMREIDAAEEGISLLRRKIEFVADSRLRAWLTLELTKCYFATGDYTLVRRELGDVMPDIQDAYRTRQAELLLARVAEKMKQPQRAESLCVLLLSDAQVEEDIRSEAFALLGRVYTGQKYYEKAALAFAGILPQEGDKQ